MNVAPHGISRGVKHALGRAVFDTGLHRALLGDRAVIALFHRVDDRLSGNPITCTTSEFAEYCDFFKRYFAVVSLTDLLERLDRGEGVGGCLAITFDDGYRDNAGPAAAELERRGLPATFFVATAFIESSRVPPWDARRSVVPEWMAWDDLRRLRERGFDIGSHTVNHVDLGSVDGPEAQAEITESRRRLERELGTTVDLFSFPFGRPKNLSAANLERVKQAGYRCCLSAYGGTVRRGVSAFELKREPIHPWFISPYHYGFELLFRGPRFSPTFPSDA